MIRIRMAEIRNTTQSINNASLIYIILNNKCKWTDQYVYECYVHINGYETQVNDTNVF